MRNLTTISKPLCRILIKIILLNLWICAYLAIAITKVKANLLDPTIKHTTNRVTMYNSFQRKSRAILFSIFGWVPKIAGFQVNIYFIFWFWFFFLGGGRGGYFKCYAKRGGITKTHFPCGLNDENYNSKYRIVWLYIAVHCQKLDRKKSKLKWTFFGPLALAGRVV